MALIPAGMYHSFGSRFVCLTEFVDDLSWNLERESVASWLLSFGANGRSLMPQVVGSLLGLQFRTVADPVHRRSGLGQDVVMKR